MNIHRLTLIAVVLSALTLLPSRSAQAQTVYIGNSLSVSNGTSDTSPPLVILGEYSPAGPLGSSSIILSNGTIQDVKFYGQNWNFKLCALSKLATGPGANEQTFQVVAGETLIGSASEPGTQTVAVSGFPVQAGDLLAFYGYGPYYPESSNDAVNSDATYEDSSDPGSFTASLPPVGPGTEFIVGVYPDTNANYEYIPNSFSNQGRTYAIGVDVSLTSQSVTSLPVYQVTQAGATYAQATNLAHLLNIPINQLVWSNGLASYVDPTNLLYVPMVPFTNAAVISNLTAQSYNPSTNPLVFQAFNIGALTNQPVYSTSAAVNSFSNALAGAGLLPAVGFAQPVVNNPVFTLFASNSSQIVAQHDLDTYVTYAFSLDNGYPLIGPGSVVAVTYGPTGNVTSLRYSARQFEPGPSVPVISAAVASNRAASLLPANAQISMRLAYVAPPLVVLNPTNIIPWYVFVGSFSVSNPVTGSITTAYTPTEIFPATDDTNYVPVINLSASAPGMTQVVASASANGGSPPYAYSWTGSDPGISTNTGASITYTPRAEVIPPPITIYQPTNGMVSVLWPYPSTGFVLESTTDLVTGEWSAVGSTVETNSGLNVVTIPVTNNNLFFRLQCTQVPTTESVGVTVTDANGVQVSTNLTTAVLAEPLPLTVSTDADFAVEDPFQTGQWKGEFGSSSQQQQYYHVGMSSQPGDYLQGSGCFSEFLGSFPHERLISFCEYLGAEAIQPAQMCGSPPTMYLQASVSKVGVNTASLVAYVGGYGTPNGFGFVWPQAAQNGTSTNFLELLDPGVNMTAAYYDYNDSCTYYDVNLGPYYVGLGSQFGGGLFPSWLNGAGNGVVYQLCWLVFDCPGVMHEGSGKTGDWYAPQRWGGAFNGPHMMLGWDGATPVQLKVLHGGASITYSDYSQASAFVGNIAQGMSLVPAWWEGWIDGGDLIDGGLNVTATPNAMGPVDQYGNTGYADDWPSSPFDTGGRLTPSVAPAIYPPFLHWWFVNGGNPVTYIP
ncbi:MAG: hypothetical protein ACLPT4_02155 [Verrucomicrobiia bacterium]